MLNVLSFYPRKSVRHIIVVALFASTSVVGLPVYSSLPGGTPATPPWGLMNRTATTMLLRSGRRLVGRRGAPLRPADGGSLMPLPACIDHSLKREGAGATPGKPSPRHCTYSSRKHLLLLHEVTLCFQGLSGHNLIK